MKFFLIVIIFFVVSCKVSYVEYKLSSGDHVCCKYDTKGDCGYTLDKCKDGNRYECQENVIVIGDCD